MKKLILPLLALLSLEARSADHRSKIGLYVRGDLSANMSRTINKIQTSNVSISQDIREASISLRGAGLGYKFTDSFRMEVNWASMKESSLTQEIKYSSLMGNGYWDFYSTSAFMPYITAGAGKVSTEPELSDYQALVWNLGLGTRFLLTENIDLDLGYRFTNYSQNLKTHEGVIGFIYHM